MAFLVDSAGTAEDGPKAFIERLSTRFVTSDAAVVAVEILQHDDLSSFA